MADDDSQVSPDTVWQQMAAGDALYLWTVYDKPLDYPGKFVARQWVVRRGEPEPLPTGQLIVAPTLDVVRRMLPPGLYRLDRSEGDEPHIVETWM